VFFEVEAAGKHYDVIHVDGGAASQVFLYPADLDCRGDGIDFELAYITEDFDI